MTALATSATSARRFTCVVLADIGGPQLRRRLCCPTRRNVWMVEWAIQPDADWKRRAGVLT
jgi:hypothetical protein